MAGQSENHSSKYRNQLPSPSSNKKEANLFGILKNSIGKELSSITMPVEFNEPLSFLQRISEYMEYSFLLKIASQCDDPLQRLQYLSAFAVSALASNWERLCKPFNPLLGETFELCREDLGFRLVCEQVSHHPPVSAFHAESEDFQFYGNIHPRLKFWGKSLEIKPEGTLTVHLLKHKEVYSWTNVHCCVHNIIIGKLWFEQYGMMEIQCHTTGMTAQLNFKPAGWFGRDLHNIEGFITDKQKKKLCFIYGKWTDYLKVCSMEDYDEYMRTHADSLNKHKHNTSMSDGSNPDDSNHDTPTKKFSNKLNVLTRSFTGGGRSTSPEPPVSPHDPPVDDNGDIPKSDNSTSLDIPNSTTLWQVQQRPDDSLKYYNFTSFAMALNELQDWMKTLPKTDSRLRPDIRMLEQGDTEGAATEKNRLEEKQRDARKQRKKKKETWKPMWFYQSKVPHIKNEIWLFNHKYWTRDFSESPDIF
ncbi:oxysterol-binding protein-related protein 2-like isoform X1 [Argiope bruennichi]|uniref:oxysterol-binding protein-related protein 2-like isoform X1 n=1 Tax=Argiope bruennichi TaxID=94029 RepID=UPI002494B0DD|nr:oxysterol-binding protein-related protein 2-like isoform X1 [Argiope bruennichi]